VRAATWPARSGDRDFIHFWAYSVCAAPGVLAALRLGFDPAWAFVGLNVALLMLATIVLARRFGVTAAVLVCAGPIVWWSDKVHTEAFTFSMLAIATGLLSLAPHWAMVAIGLAATQNPPLAILLVPWAAAGWHVGAIRSPRQFASGLAAGVAIAAAHPVYYLIAFGRVSLLTSGSRGVIPTAQEVGAVLWDTNLGLIPGDPVFVMAVVVALGAVGLSRLRVWRDPEVLASAAAVAVILGAAAQTTNIQHGGTPGISRYALWLLPFAAPLVHLACRGRVAHRVCGLLAVVSAAVCLVAYRPAVAEGAYRPSILSRVLWTRYPSLVNPLPEVFSETVTRIDGPITVPVALSGCEKALLLGGIRRRGLWPIPCYPSIGLPSECRGGGALCYANRESGGFTYGTVARPRGMDIQYDPTRAWTVEAEPAIRRAYDEAGWWTLRPGDEFDVTRAVRQVTGVDQLWHFQSDRAVLLVARGIAPRAFVSVRPPRPMSGVVMDGTTGASISTLTLPDGPATRVDVPLPAGHDLIVVVLR
jgi:hypothetical protein